MAESDGREGYIIAETRNEFGKGAARRIRREGKVPAVVYAKDHEPWHVTLPGHSTWLAMKHLGSNALLHLTIDGKEQLALTKQVQADPIHRTLTHVDFVSVKKGQKVTVDVPVHVEGEAAPETLVTLDQAEVSIEAEATHIPEYIEVSVEGLESGTQILAAQLSLPAGSTMLTDPEMLVVNVTDAPTEAEVEAELEEAEAEAGVERDESDEDEGQEAAEGAEDAAEGAGDSEE